MEKEIGRPVREDLREIKEILKNMSVLVCDIIHNQLNEIDRQISVKTRILKTNKELPGEETTKLERDLKKLHDRYIELFLAMAGLLPQENEENEDNE